MGGKGKQTIGYHYMFTFIAGFGRGPINQLRQIVVDEKVAWDGTDGCGTDPYIIDEPDLFGGEKSEGGIQGAFRILWGNRDQVLPPAATVNIGSKPVESVTIPNVKDALGGLVSEFRGFTALIFDGLVASMNPYLKEWKFRVRRHTAGWYNDMCWYPGKAPIYMAGGQIHAMNPAHIIYECLTNPEWGKGEPISELDENSFIYAANTLCSEGFGLCIPWFRQEDVDDFIQIVVDHIGGMLYNDRRTGKWVLRLLRDDYDPDTVPFFDLDTGLLSIEDDDSASAEAINEVIVTGHDPITDKDFQVRAQNLAGWHSQGGPISRSMEFKGIPTPDLALRKAQQELRTLSAGLKKFRLSFDRRAWQLQPGSVIRIASPRNNLENVLVRLGEITESPAGDGKIVAKAMEDVFALPETTFTSASESTWTPPNTIPEPAPAERLIEMGYRDILVKIGVNNMGTVQDTDALIGTLAISPGTGSYLYDIASKVDSEPAYQIKTNANYTGSATLVGAIGPLTTTFTIADGVNFDAGNIDEFLLIDNELVYLEDFDPGTNQATVKRGCGDTIPAAHAPGARIWAVDDDLSSDERSYAAGETVLAKVLPRTSSKVLSQDEAEELSVELIGRHARPYPPGNVKVDGVSIFEALSGEHPEPVLTWAHRDRVLQEDQAVGHTEASVGPEAGTTYTVRIYDPTDLNTPIGVHDGITGDTWTYTSGLQASDGAGATVVMQIESERDGLTSWQSYNFSVPVSTGWDLGWGLNWGGA